MEKGFSKPSDRVSANFSLVVDAVGSIVRSVRCTPLLDKEGAFISVRIVWDAREAVSGQSIVKLDNLFKLVQL